MADHRPHPAYGEPYEAWDTPTPGEQQGLEWAAAICRLYGDGERWAEVILCRGEQIRARFYGIKDGTFLR